MFDLAFNSICVSIYMNGHGIYVWSDVIMVLISLLSIFIGYNLKIKKLKKKFNESK